MSTSNVQFSPSQQEVVDQFPIFLLDDDSKELIISGFAGSGKSFLTRYLADVVDDQMTMIRAIRPSVAKKKVVFAATTNKAAEVLRKMTGKDAHTIHKLLGLVVHTNYKTGQQTLKDKGRKTDLSNTVLFIDEASMIDYQLLQHIRKAQAKFKGCKIVYIGDAYQLPPVFEMYSPVFRTNKRNNLFQLKEIQRQAATNPILVLAQGYREVIDDPTQDWPIIPNDGNHIIVHSDYQTYKFAIENAFLHQHDVDDCRILAWENKRVQEYNSWLRGLMGLPATFQTGETVLTNKPLMDGNSILAQTDSLHQVRQVSGVFNQHGCAGYSVALEGFSKAFFQPLNWAEVNTMLRTMAHEASAKSDWTEYYQIKDNWVDLRPVHAITVHKSQGSTFREVFVDMGNISKNNKWHEAVRLAYVAISRASERVHILGNLSPRYKTLTTPPSMEAFNNVSELL